MGKEGWVGGSIFSNCLGIKKDLYSQKGSGTQYPLGDKKKGKKRGSFFSKGGQARSKRFLHTDGGQKE